MKQRVKANVRVGESETGLAVQLEWPAMDLLPPTDAGVRLSKWPAMDLLPPTDAGVRLSKWPAMDLLPPTDAGFKG